MTTNRLYLFFRTMQGDCMMVSAQTMYLALKALAETQKWNEGDEVQAIQIIPQNKPQAAGFVGEEVHERHPFSTEKIGSCPESGMTTHHVPALTPAVDPATIDLRKTFLHLGRNNGDNSVEVVIRYPSEAEATHVVIENQPNQSLLHLMLKGWWKVQSSGLISNDLDEFEPHVRLEEVDLDHGYLEFACDLMP